MAITAGSTILVADVLQKSDGSNFKLVATTTGGIIDPSFFKMPTVQIFTAGSGTWSKPAGCRYIVVEVVGGGGAGGSTSNVNIISGGGGAGGYARKIYNVMNTTSVVLFVGSKGLGVTGNSAGGNGSRSMFGTTPAIVSADGGTGGPSGTGTGGNGGSASGGDINITGAQGSPGQGNSASFNSGQSMRAPSYFGNTYGYGGGGNLNSSAGDNGGDGVIVVTEHYN